MGNVHPHSLQCALDAGSPPELDDCQCRRGTAANHEDTACRHFHESTLPKADYQLLRCKPHSPEYEPSLWLQARLPGTYLLCLCRLRQTELQCRQAVAYGLIQARGLHVVHAIIHLLSLEEQSLHKDTCHGLMPWGEHSKRVLSVGMLCSLKSHCWGERVAQPQTRVDTAAFEYLLASAIHAIICATEQELRCDYVCGAQHERAAGRARHPSL